MSISRETALPPSPPPKPPREHRILRELQRMLDDFVIARSIPFDRRRTARSAALMRRTILAEGFQDALGGTLKGITGDRNCWTDENLRLHALKRVIQSFDDSLQWCRETTHAIYLLDPQSVAEIDHIIEAHVESRAGAFSPELYKGRGWDPSRAIYFNQDSHIYARAYVALSKRDWSAVEYALSPDTIVQGSKSGFEVLGQRGCVGRLTLSHSVDAREADAYRKTFLQRKRSLTTKALRDFVPDTLSKAITQGETFDDSFGPVRVRFRTNVHADPPEGGTSTCEFWLSFQHA